MKDIKRTVGLSVVLNTTEAEMLDKICWYNGRTKSEMVRELIRREYEERFSKENNDEAVFSE